MSIRQTIEDHLLLNKTILHVLQLILGDKKGDGRIVVRKNKNGSSRQYYAYPERDEDGRVKWHTRKLSPEEETDVDALQRQTKAGRLQQTIKRNIRLLRMLLNRYREIGPDALQGIIPTEHLAEMFPPNCASRYEFGRLRPAGNGYRPEGLQFQLGERWFRTRIEYMIATCLLALNIPFIYEPVIRMDGYNYYPDFAILRRSDNTVIFWEHFGRMFDAEYRMTRFDRLRTFWEMGIRIGDNLIVTVEGDGSAPITTAQIKRMIESYCL